MTGDRGRGRDGDQDARDGDQEARDGDALARLEANVRGRVQGVGYRVFALREAGYLGLAGFVANEPDGSVRVVAEGPRADLEALLERLEEGPPAGFVDRVTVRWEPARGVVAGFRIAGGSHRGD